MNNNFASLTITSHSLAGDNVAKTFNAVINMNIDYYHGSINVVDQAQGSFYFPYGPVATFTVTITGGSTMITIS